MKSDEVFLRHMLDELDFLLKQTRGIDFDGFATDDVLRRACARSLEIIGEAVKNVSPDLRQSSGSSGFCGSRNRPFFRGIREIRPVFAKRCQAQKVRIPPSPPLRRFARSCRFVWSSGTLSATPALEAPMKYLADSLRRIALIEDASVIQRLTATPRATDRDPRGPASCAPLVPLVDGAPRRGNALDEFDVATTPPDSPL